MRVCATLCYCERRVGAFTVNVAIQKAFKWVYKATVRQAVARKEKKKIMQRASPGLICRYYFSNLPDDWTHNQYVQASVRGKETTVKDG